MKKFPENAFTYEQVMDMNFPVKIERGRMAVNPSGFYQQIDEQGWPCIMEEPAKPGSNFDFRPVPTFEEVMLALPSWYQMSWRLKEGQLQVNINSGLPHISGGNSIAEALCDAYLYAKKVTYI